MVTTPRLRAEAPTDIALLKTLLGRAGYVQAVQHNSVYGHRGGVNADKVLNNTLGIPRARPTFDPRVNYTPDLFLRTLRAAAASSFTAVTSSQPYGTSPVITFVTDNLARQRARS